MFVCGAGLLSPSPSHLNSDYQFLLTVDYFWKRHKNCPIFKSEKGWWNVGLYLYCSCFDHLSPNKRQAWLQNCMEDADRHTGMKCACCGFRHVYLSISRCKKKERLQTNQRDLLYFIHL